VHTYVDGPANRTIHVDLLNDSGQALNRFSLAVQVRDLGSVIDNLMNSASIPGETRPDEVVTVTTVYSDPGKSDTHSVIIDWGDGSPAQPATVMESDGSGTADATHRYSTGGVYTVNIELADDDGAATTQQTTAYITGIRQFETILQIVGSEENDIVTVVPQGASQFFVDMTIPSLGNFRHSFDLEQVSGIDVYVGAGNDRVMVSNRLHLETFMVGGPDDDHVQGGHGPNTLFGGPGTDRLLGGDDRDILVGGEGSDTVFGYGEDDVLVGDAWEFGRHDTAATTVWRSSSSFDDRQTAISGLAMISADSASDTLFGGGDSNLFFISGADDFKDDSPGARYTLQQARDFGWAVPQANSVGLFSIVVGRAQQAGRVGEAPPVSEGEGTERGRLDVNGDGHISAMDVVMVVNELNRRGSRHLATPSRYDSSGNGWITSEDVRLIVNSINASGAVRMNRASSAAQLAHQPEADLRGSADSNARVLDRADWISERTRADRDNHRWVKFVAGCATEEWADQEWLNEEWAATLLDIAIDVDRLDAARSHCRADSGK
jgi:hypothetical protein